VFNQQFLKLIVSNLEYDDEKISKIYNLEFEEFKSEDKPSDSMSEEVKDNIQKLENNIKDLQSKLNSNTTSTDVDRLNSELKANKDIIIQLRIDSGEGVTDKDFSEEFPYFSKIH
jgi:protein associated with RNAse G/E